MSTEPLSLNSEHLLPATGVGIRRIRVTGLFGQFNYDLQCKSIPLGRASRVLMLYGENGSGKTTILRMIFNLLSYLDDKGHKSKVMRVRFKDFRVELADGTEIIAEKKEDQDTTVEVFVRKMDRIVAQGIYPKNLDRPGPEAPADQIRNYFEQQHIRDSNHFRLLQALKSLGLGMIYLTDNRVVHSTVPGVPSVESEDQVEHGRSRSLKWQVDSASNAETILTRAVDQVSSWATRQALQGSKQGEEDVNSVYANIVSRLAAFPWESARKSENIEPIINILEEQQRRSVEFVRFGLAKPLRVNEIVSSLRKMGPQTRSTIIEILEPYVNGVKKRFDALDPIRIKLAGFVDTMNSFYRNKHIDLDVNQGVIIQSTSGDRLSPNMLSSGEAQLLFLLASTIVAKESSSLFMIDEPELSLNVIWQRQLVRYLLELTRESNVQFILATHSIELLTRYSEFVLDLESGKKN